jgi:hypothetical protein
MICKDCFSVKGILLLFFAACKALLFLVASNFVMDLCVIVVCFVIIVHVTFVSLGGTPGIRSWCSPVRMTSIYYGTLEHATWPCCKLCKLTNYSIRTLN